MGCTATSFNVHVRSGEPEEPIRRASVFLYDDVRNPCLARAEAGGRTNEKGDVLVEASECGRRGLWVWADGYVPVSRKIDSCDGEARTVDLERVRAEPLEQAFAALPAAQSFFDALRTQNLEALRAVLAEPADAFRYLGQTLSTRDDVCVVQLLRAREGVEIVLEFASYCRSGCHAPWRLIMVRAGEDWRVRSFELIAG